jgi:ABC-type phosphate/phosphonate transport system permease subunit
LGTIVFLFFLAVVSPGALGSTFALVVVSLCALGSTPTRSTSMNNAASMRDGVEYDVSSLVVVLFADFLCLDVAPFC